MSEQPLILLGASARAAAWSARRAGFRPHSYDLFADADTAAAGPAERVTAYPAGFERALSAAPTAPWIYTGSLENYPELVDRLAAIRPLWGNPAAVLRRVRDPFALAAVLRGAGYAYPEISRSLPRQTTPWLRKPIKSGGGLGIRRATLRSGASPEWYFQEFVRGTPASTLYVATDFQAVCLGTTRQLVGPSWGPVAEFQYVGSIAPLPLQPGQRARLEEIGGLLANEFRLRGLFGVDLLVTDEGRIVVLEVNPRYTASVEVLERHGGSSIIELHAAAMIGNRLVPQTVAGTSYHGKAIVFAPRDIRIGQNWNDFVAEENANPELPSVADLPHAGDTIREGDPICTVFATGGSDAIVEAGLRERADTVLRQMQA